MPSSAAYRLLFAELAAQFLVALPKRRQVKLVDRSRELADHPFIVSDYAENDSDGRRIDHLLTDSFVITYWVDHSSRQVLIVEFSDTDEA